MTRIEEARRKLHVARTAIGVSAVAAFALFAGLARASHPGAHHASNAGSAASSRTQSVTHDDGWFGGGSSSFLGPSGSAAPQVQSGAS